MFGPTATVHGTYGDWCWQPIGCRAELISADDARTCFGDKTIAVLGDSNTMHVANSIAG